MTRLEAKMLDALERISQQIARLRNCNSPLNSDQWDVVMDISDIAECAIADTKIQIALGQTG